MHPQPCSLICTAGSPTWEINTIDITYIDYTSLPTLQERFAGQVFRENMPLET